MKKFYSLFLLGVLLMGLVACHSPEENLPAKEQEMSFQEEEQRGGADPVFSVQEPRVSEEETRTEEEIAPEELEALIESKEGFVSLPGKEGEELYYLVEGEPYLGWMKEEDNYYFFQPEKGDHLLQGAAAKGLVKAEGDYYLFGEDHILIREDTKRENKTYVLDRVYSNLLFLVEEIPAGDHKVYTVQKTVSGILLGYTGFYEPEEGQLRYFLEGKMARGWIQDGDNRYYARLGSGSLAKGWQYIDGNWYYFRQGSGSQVTGRQYIDGKWRQFSEDGVLEGER